MAAEKARRRPEPSLLWCPHRPTERQAVFLALHTAEEVLYGGAAGGGKSDALLMAALEYVHVPGYAALLLRRTFADLSLPDAIMSRAQEWLRGTAAKWHDKEKTWTFPSGATLTFGYLENEADKYRYQGAAFQFVGFDEVTQFLETQYRYLLSRIRRPSGGGLATVPLRMRAAGNPGGVGHEWVRARFLEEGRPFVPAKLADNPHLDQVAYRAQLEKLDPVTRAQLLEGDWTISAKGPMFDRAWFRIVEQPPQHPHIYPQCRYWDLAATEAKPGKDPDWTAGARVLVAAGEWYVLDMQRRRATPKTIEDLVRHTAEVDGRAVRIRMEQEPGSSGVNTIDYYQRRILLGYDFKGDKKTGNKIDLARPLSAAAEAGHVYLVRGAWNGALLDELSGFPLAGHDDQVDALSGATRTLSEAVARLSDLPDREEGVSFGRRF